MADRSSTPCGTSRCEKPMADTADKVYHQGSKTGPSTAQRKVHAQRALAPEQADLAIPSWSSAAAANAAARSQRPQTPALELDAFGCHRSNKEHMDVKGSRILTVRLRKHRMPSKPSTRAPARNCNTKPSRPAHPQRTAQLIGPCDISAWRIRAGFDAIRCGEKYVSTGFVCREK